MAATKIGPGGTRIGWIGTGVMGASMCMRLVKAGYDTVVYSRTKKKAEGLLKSGAAWAKSPEEVSRRSDVIFTMVGFPEDVKEVYFGKDGIFKGAGRGSVLVDMTTTEPSIAEEIYKAAKKAGASAVDAPVSGGDIGAKEGKLSIMAGGDRKTFDALMPLFELLGKNIVYQGGPGFGQHTKMCNQIMVTGLMIGMCETLLYAYKAGLDPERMLMSVGRGAAACWMLDNLAPRMLKRDFSPGFYVEHFIKDMGIALREAERMNLVLPGISLVRQLYVAASAQGHGRKGTQALLLALESISGISRKEPEK
ncbi:MAG TPA: NAD(P)-dependent oxidoreductase [Thermodesulfobacteriota bacterium]|nr:NAD(P)-dependent oxidoreductase [Thermodesulfobacteriota bacterium]